MNSNKNTSIYIHQQFPEKSQMEITSKIIDITNEIDLPSYQPIICHSQPSEIDENKNDIDKLRKLHPRYRRINGVHIITDMDIDKDIINMVALSSKYRISNNDKNNAIKQFQSAINDLLSKTNKKYARRNNIRSIRHNQQYIFIAKME